jgi:hypothetical protein
MEKMVMSTAGELVLEAERKERARCLRVFMKHIRRESRGRCCDNCNCMALRRAIEELHRK